MKRLSNSTIPSCALRGSTARTVLAIFLSVVALWAYGHRTTLADAALEDTNPAQWRLIWKADPAHQATVSWSTAERGETHRLHYKAADAESFIALDCQRNGKHSNKKSDLRLYYHHARLTDLQPSTQYVIVLESDGRKSPEMHFITAPDDDRDIHLIFGGDSRTDRPMRRKVNQMLSRMLSERPSIVGFAHGGDYIEKGKSLEQWSAWLSDHELTVTTDGRMLPIIPTRGNHDVGPIFNELFDFPKKDKNYYALNLNSEICLITLNTETSTAGDQAEWLSTELQHVRPANRWLLAQYHRPAYPAIKMPSGAKQSWVPLFEKYNVDLVMEADGHNIKRTPPIRDNRVDPTGVVYIGEGGLGVPQRTPFTSRWFLKSPGMASKGHHVQLLTFTQESLTCRVILLGGKLFDETVIVPYQQRLKLAGVATPIMVGK